MASVNVGSVNVWLGILDSEPLSVVNVGLNHVEPVDVNSEDVCSLDLCPVEVDSEELFRVDVESSWVTEGSPPISEPVTIVVEPSELLSSVNVPVCDSTPTPDVKPPVDPGDVEVFTSE